MGVVATIPPLRGPTRHTTARKRRSGRSGRDDSVGADLWMEQLRFVTCV